MENYEKLLERRKKTGRGRGEGHLCYLLVAFFALDSKSLLAEWHFFVKASETRKKLM
jgi:hypothetical protein